MPKTSKCQVKIYHLVAKIKKMWEKAYFKKKMKIIARINWKRRWAYEINKKREDINNDR